MNSNDFAIIDKEKRQKLYVELYVDIKAELQKEIDNLKIQLADAILNDNSDEIVPIKTEIQKKISEQNSIDENENNPTNIDELVSRLARYVSENLNNNESPIRNQVMPLMCNAMSEATKEIIGESEANLILSLEFIRSTILFSMIVGFALHNLLKSHNMKIQGKAIQLSEAEYQEIIELSEKNRQLFIQLLAKGLSNGEDYPL